MGTQFWVVLKVRQIGKQLWSTIDLVNTKKAQMKPPVATYPTLHAIFYGNPGTGTCLLLESTVVTHLCDIFKAYKPPECAGFFKAKLHGLRF